MKTADDKNLGDAIPTKFPEELEAMIKDLEAHSRLPRSTVIRRCVRFAMDEVQRRGDADWLLYDEKPPIGFLMGKTAALGQSGEHKATASRKNATKRKVSVPAARTIYRDLFLGDAPAGMPCPGAFRPDAWEETIRVETKKFPSAAFALRVRGESMTGIGINDGDILIFANAEQQEPRAGDVVAAHIDGEVTIKTLIKTNGMITLRAENPAYPNPLITSSSAVQGVMIGKL